MKCLVEQQTRERRKNKYFFFRIYKPLKSVFMFFFLPLTPSMRTVFTRVSFHFLYRELPEQTNNISKYVENASMQQEPYPIHNIFICMCVYVSVW